MKASLILNALCVGDGRAMPISSDLAIRVTGAAVGCQFLKVRRLNCIANLLCLLGLEMPRRPIRFMCGSMGGSLAALIVS